MRFLFLLVGLATCGQDLDPNCQASLEKAAELGQQLTRMELTLSQLQMKANDTTERTRTLIPQAPRAMPSACDAQLTVALQRADTAERALEEFQSNANRIAKDFRDPRVSYDTWTREVESMATGVTEE